MWVIDSSNSESITADAVTTGDVIALYPGHGFKITYKSVSRRTGYTTIHSHGTRRQIRSDTTVLKLRSECEGSNPVDKTMISYRVIVTDRFGRSWDYTHSTLEEAMSRYNEASRNLLKGSSVSLQKITTRVLEFTGPQS